MSQWYTSALADIADAVTSANDLNASIAAATSKCPPYVAAASSAQDDAPVKDARHPDIKSFYSGNSRSWDAHKQLKRGIVEQAAARALVELARAASEGLGASDVLVIVGYPNSTADSGSRMDLVAKKVTVADKIGCTWTYIANAMTRSVSLSVSAKNRPNNANAAAAIAAAASEGASIVVHENVLTQLKGLRDAGTRFRVLVLDDMMSTGVSLAAGVNKVKAALVGGGLPADVVGGALFTSPRLGGIALNTVSPARERWLLSLLDTYMNGVAQWYRLNFGTATASPAIYFRLLMLTPSEQLQIADLIDARVGESIEMEQEGRRLGVGKGAGGGPGNTLVEAAARIMPSVWMLRWAKATRHRFRDTVGDALRVAVPVSYVGQVNSVNAQRAVANRMKEEDSGRDGTGLVYQILELARELPGRTDVDYENRVLLKSEHIVAWANAAGVPLNTAVNLIETALIKKLHTLYRFAGTNCVLETPFYMWAMPKTKRLALYICGITRLTGVSEEDAWQQRAIDVCSSDPALLRFLEHHFGGAGEAITAAELDKYLRRRLGECTWGAPRVPGK